MMKSRRRWGAGVLVLLPMVLMGAGLGRAWSAHAEEDGAPVSMPVSRAGATGDVYATMEAGDRRADPGAEESDAQESAAQDPGAEAASGSEVAGNTEAAGNTGAVGSADAAATQDASPRGRGVSIAETRQSLRSGDVYATMEAGDRRADPGAEESDAQESAAQDPGAEAASGSEVAGNTEAAGNTGAVGSADAAATQDASPRGRGVSIAETRQSL